MTDALRDAGQFSASDILVGTGALLRRFATRTLVAMAILSGAGIALDTYRLSGEAASGFDLLLSMLTVVVQYWLIKAALDDLGHSASGRARFPAFFLLGLVTTIGILLGFIVLIVPGIMLAVRWSIATLFLLGADEGVTDSMASSWRETEGHFWPIFLAFLSIYAPTFLLAAAGAAMEFSPAASLVGIIAFNLGIYAGLMIGWYAAIAVYLLLRAPETLSRIFE